MSLSGQRAPKCRTPGCYSLASLLIETHLTARLTLQIAPVLLAYLWVLTPTAGQTTMLTLAIATSIQKL
ncbi:hypothetical protein F4777DRAFT_582306 [Nemania sp. FL0916]|nr:hypothetical protein F4777DRAFT_582306 [Nemania sp. FL0916]